MLILIAALAFLALFCLWLGLFDLNWDSLARLKTRRVQNLGNPEALVRKKVRSALAKCPAPGQSTNITTLITQAGLKISFKEYLMMAAAATGLGFFLGLSLNNWFIALIGAYMGFQIPKKVIQYLRDKRQQIIARQVEPALQQIANLYRITQSIEKAVEEATSTMASPLREEFERLQSDLKIAGMTLEQALLRLSHRLGNKDFEFFTKIALLTRKYGGETKDLMLQIPQTIRERQMIRAELETELAGAKQQSWLLLAGTPLFFIVYKLMRPDFAQILTTTAMGKLGMSVVAVLTLVSIALIEKITEPLS